VCDTICSDAIARPRYNYYIIIIIIIIRRGGAGVCVRDSGGGFMARAGTYAAAVVVAAAAPAARRRRALCREALASPTAASCRRSDWTNRRPTWAFPTSDPGAPSRRRHPPHIYGRSLVVIRTRRDRRHHRYRHRHHRRRCCSAVRGTRVDDSYAN